MATDEFCGDFAGDEGWLSAECCLRKGHLGDHYAVVTWPQRGPWAPSEQAENRWLPKLWGKTLEHALSARILRPVEPKDHVVNRDEITFHNEPHPQLPGVVIAVLDQQARVDAATGAVEWGD